MKISDLHLSHDDEYQQINATIEFEDCDQPRQDIFIKTTKKFAQDISLNPHAFLVGCIIPAMRFSEKRIFIDEEICPSLKEGLEVAMALTDHWTKGKYKPLKIESKTSSHADSNPGGHAGMVISGGIDSLAALRLNRLRYPDSHPGYIKDGLFLHGFDIGGVVKRGMKYHVFDRAMDAISKIADDANIELIPVYTNIRHLCDERDLWLDNFFGAVLAAIAHSFVARLKMIYIASSYDIPHLHMVGSHPLLDPEYSSYDLRIRHRDYELSRIEKQKIVAGWDVAFQNFRVCLANVPDRLNCGKCEKCVRTMTELVALGVLTKTQAFVEDDVTPDMIDQYDITIRTRPPFYNAMIPLLKKQGRDDLVNIIQKQIKDLK